MAYSSRWWYSSISSDFFLSSLIYRYWIFLISLSYSCLKSSSYLPSWYFSNYPIYPLCIQFWYYKPIWMTLSALSDIAISSLCLTNWFGSKNIPSSPTRSAQAKFSVISDRYTHDMSPDYKICAGSGVSLTALRQFSLSENFGSKFPSYSLF